MAQHHHLSLELPEPWLTFELYRLAFWYLVFYISRKTTFIHNLSTSWIYITFFLWLNKNNDLIRRYMQKSVARHKKTPKQIPYFLSIVVYKEIHAVFIVFEYKRNWFVLKYMLEWFFCIQMSETVHFAGIIFSNTFTFQPIR